MFVDDIENAAKDVAYNGHEVKNFDHDIDFKQRFILALDLILDNAVVLYDFREPQKHTGRKVKNYLVVQDPWQEEKNYYTNIDSDTYCYFLSLHSGGDQIGNEHREQQDHEDDRRVGDDIVEADVEEGEEKEEGESEEN